MNLYETKLILISSVTDFPFLELNIKWRDNFHILIAVNNHLGTMEQMCLFKRSSLLVYRWYGFSRGQEHTIQGYGLQVSPEQAGSPQVSSYSVEATDNVVISPASNPQERIKTMDLRGKIHQFTPGKMINMLGAQDVLEMEVVHKAPLDYSLKPTGPSDSKAGLCVVFCERSQKEYVVMSSAPVSAGIPLLPVCRSRTNYKVKVVGLKLYKKYTFGQQSPVCYQYEACRKSSVISIKTCMSKEELQQLKTMAVTYCHSKSRNPGKYTIKQFYRSKPERYYTHIMSNKGGVMEKYIKDNNGDPYSAINKKINGLFFSGSLDTRTRKPPDFSYFGDKRLFIPAEELFTWDTRMYFADFYCLYETHYVTVVVTKTGSAEDRFCEGRLLELDLKDNPFFTIKQGTGSAANNPGYGQLSGLSSTFGSLSMSQGYSHHASPYSLPSRQNAVQKTFTMVSVHKFHVEFLYTEDVDIRGLERRCGEGRVYFKSVQGLGESKKDGIPKNTNCPVCNLGAKA
ncbi:phytanoyl-CoA hydroxylase-interacting protein-like isoform X1 [Haliotis rufescens]|uniref:phytanoyl-CoA hydroxylase-interacting protein-like isoform X1 n=2 Tax=Haliotis rufescens TaxID=6454 RepID=UPI00201F36B9|nr:phytanoyl-CoA hydroxylase-interacting protein-like isoform X1 [Haliotis rufescens]